MTRLFLSALLISTALHCGSTPPPPALVSAATSEPPPTFAFQSLDGRPISSDSMRGRPAVLMFGTTWDLITQAQVQVMVNGAKGATPQFAVVMLQTEADRELVELYAADLHIDFPVALLPPESAAVLRGVGPVTSVPTTIMLNSDGRVVHRKNGLVRADEFRALLRDL